MEQWVLIIILTTTLLVHTRVYLVSRLAGILCMVPGVIIWLKITFRMALICETQALLLKICIYLPVFFILIVPCIAKLVDVWRHRRVSVQGDGTKRKERFF